MEKKNRFHKIVGVSQEEGNFVQGDIRSRFEKSSHPAISRELPKSKEILLTIESLDNTTRAIMTFYGGIETDFNASRVHLLAPEDITDDPNIEGEMFGYYDSFEGRAYIAYDKTQDSLYALSRRIAHEMFHGRAHNAAQEVMGSDGDIQPHRNGLMFDSRDGKEHFFHYLNEAITEELAFFCVGKGKEGLSPRAQTFERKLNVLAKECKEESELAQHLQALEEEMPEAALEYHRAWKINNAYQVARAAFSNLLGLLEERGVAQATAKELFYRAYFSGDLRPLVRTFDTTFSKGALRRLGEASHKSQNEFLKHVQGLRNAKSMPTSS